MIVNIHEAKTHLSKLVERAASGEAVVIAKAGRPLVRLVPVEEPSSVVLRRVGFLAGAVTSPDDFDTMGGTLIAEAFEGTGEPSDRNDP